MFFEKNAGNPFRRDERVVELLKQLKLIQRPGPMSGRLEEINALTKRFGLGDEWLTDWKLGPSQLSDNKVAVAKRPDPFFLKKFPKPLSERSKSFLAIAMRP